MNEKQIEEITEQAANSGTVDELVGILQNEGYIVTVGYESVQRLIRVAADDSTDKRCSGWRVFPDGTKCDGCGDCNPNGSHHRRGEQKEEVGNG